MMADDLAGELDADVRTVYEELLKTRDRLAGLPPLGGEDFNDLNLALHETIFYCLTGPAERASLPLSAKSKKDFLSSARDSDRLLFAAVVAVIAAKIGQARVHGSTLANQLRIVVNDLDLLAFDHRAPKKTILAALREARVEVDDRIKLVKATRMRAFRFPKPPEKYSSRQDKSETPDRFFKRVYGGFVPRGLTQGDIRRADPAFYSVFHTWCSRHKRRVTGFVPPSR